MVAFTLKHTLPVLSSGFIPKQNRLCKQGRFDKDSIILDAVTVSQVTADCAFSEHPLILSCSKSPGQTSDWITGSV